MIERGVGGSTLGELVVGRLSIDQLVAIVSKWRGLSLDPIGIDAPFGFPAAFTQSVRAMIDGGMPAVGDPVWRVTEKYIKPLKQPLSPVTSLITNTVVSRCFPLRQALAGPLAADLIGYQSRIFEVYPAATLVAWGIPVAGSASEASYKRAGPAGDPARGRILEALCGRVPWLDIAEYRTVLLDSDDAIDALVAALVAAVAARPDRPTGPDLLGDGLPAVEAQILQEGWIHVGDRESLQQSF